MVRGQNMAPGQLPAAVDLAKQILAFGIEGVFLVLATAAQDRNIRMHAESGFGVIAGHFAKHFNVADRSAQARRRIFGPHQARVEALDAQFKIGKLFVVDRSAGGRGRRRATILAKAVLAQR